MGLLVLPSIMPSLYIAPPWSAELPEKVTFIKVGLLVPFYWPSLHIAPPRSSRVTGEGHVCQCGAAGALSSCHG